MSSKKIFTKKELDTLSAEDLINKIIYENYSLLKTLGGEKLRREMIPVGKACHLVANYFYKTTGPKNDEIAHIKSARKKLVRSLSRIAPATYQKSAFPHNSKNGLVIGFNHPSLGEILRLVTMKIAIMGDKPMLFPVNLPWYEAIAPDYDLLKKLGIIITPTITPKTWTKLNLNPNTKLFEAALRLKRDFRNIYTELSHHTVKTGGVIFVAPAATRQSTVFKNRAVFDKKEDVIPTMSILALKLYADPTMNCDFLPVAILPPKRGRGLNLFKTYKLIPAPIITAKEIRQKYFKTKNPKKLNGFDYDFHLEIAQKLPQRFWY